ncbi:MmgE/PrpD family protein [Halomarina pelagica]|uniref:MmgE/PrpD family protein n=1 Tax=Halomarina pelagica TaxID=2961599 RepID=UPI0020C54241|nr:MmgE/PrpD family protein [Halomarina sp. BND7]
MDETTALASFAVSTELSDVPEPEIDHAKRAVRDYLGVAVYGSRHEVGDRIAAYVEASSPGTDATVFARGSASAPGAALANGTFGHAIDYDDTFESIVIHPTSPVFAAALAAAERADADGRALLAGYAVGVETAFRVGHATYPSHYDNGWHSTGTVGSFGAAAAAASVLGLSVEETRHAFGVVASGSSSLKRNFGSMTKPLHAGHAAQIGVRAALLAREGFTADPSVLSGEIGYGAVMTPGGGYDPGEITDGLGETWSLTDVGFKPYPSGVITHAAMDALRGIVEREDLAPADVASITVALDDAASEMLIHADPQNALQAKFSIEFCLAAVLRERDAGVREFTDEYVAEAETRDAIARVERAFEPNLFGAEFAGYGARVTVETTDGEEHVAEERHAPGGPTNPVSEARLRAKFDECAGTVLGADDADALAAAVVDLESDGALSDLLDVLRVDRTA